MAIARVLILAIIVIVFTFTFVPTTNTENVMDEETERNVNNMLGLWYFVAELNIDPSVDVVECRTINVVKIKDNHLNMSSRTLIGGEYESFFWKAQVLNKKLYNYKPRDGDLTLKIEEHDIFENDHFLVLTSTTDAQVYAIHSRIPNITEESLTKYKITASFEQLYLHYADNRYCRPRSILQWRFDLGDIYSIIGRWYMVLGICPEVLSYESSCANMNITKGPDDLIKINTHKEHGSISYDRKWNAKIFYSDLCEMNSKILNPPSYSIAYYNDKDELYLHSKGYPGCDSVWSRRNFLSNESHNRYKKIAENKGWFLRQIAHLVCE